MATINDVLAASMDNLLCQGFDLSMFVPKYIVKNIVTRCNNMFTVHLTRKHPNLNLHVLAFYVACRRKFLSFKIDPDAEFIRAGRTDRARYLKRIDIVNNFHGRSETYYIVHAAFTDINSPLDFGFSVQACSLNVTMHVTKESRERVKNACNGDYAGLFEKFLFWVGYPKAVYAAAGKARSLHRLRSLQKEIEGAITEGTFF